MRVEVEGVEFEVRVEQGAGGVSRIWLDGEPIDWDARRSHDGCWSFLGGGRSWEAWVVQDGADPAALQVATGGAILTARIVDPRAYRPGGGDAAHGDGGVELRAPMPGKVVSLLVAEGDQVKGGQGLVVVEAMKMENEFSSPKDGRIVKLPVSEGQAVEANQLLAVVE